MSGCQAFSAPARAAALAWFGWCRHPRGQYRAALASTTAGPRVEYGGLAALPGILRAAQRRRVWLLSGPSARYVELVRPTLAGVEVEVFAQARRHVPSGLVEAARLALRAFGADAVVSIGGGSATGLGKALRLHQPFFFVAVPTTYAGSELTDMYGITSAAGKQTGRDPRVVPDVALYDVALTRDMPLAPSAASLLNALAHPVSALSTGQLRGDAFAQALQAALAVYQALDAVLRDPHGLLSRTAALHATVLAGAVLRTCRVGVHHHWAHALGGLLDLDHAGLHSVLLPHFVSWMSEMSPEAHAALRERLQAPELAGTLFDMLARSGAPTSMAQLGLSAEAFAGFLASHPDVPGELLARAYAGQRPLAALAAGPTPAPALAE
jgi:maleylacetate reductase